jgi:hypothetical protein
LSEFNIDGTFFLPPLPSSSREVDDALRISVLWTVAPGKAHMTEANELTNFAGVIDADAKVSADKPSSIDMRAGALENHSRAAEWAVGAAAGEMGAVMSADDEGEGGTMDVWFASSFMRE